MTRFSRTRAMTSRARKLRSDATPYERKLWHALSGEKLGRSFRRQHSVGPYVLDFYCPVAKLAIELDGRVHDSRVVRDRARTRYLAGKGIRVLRFANRDVIDQFEAVLDGIRNALVEQ